MMSSDNWCGALIYRKGRSCCPQGRNVIDMTLGTEEGKIPACPPWGVCRTQQLSDDREGQDPQNAQAY
jgi:hypothetical protein